MEFSKSTDKKYTWNCNGRLKYQQEKVINSFTSFHHTAYLKNITNCNRKDRSTSPSALPPIPYVIPKQRKLINSLFNYKSKQRSAIFAKKIENKTNYPEIVVDDTARSQMIDTITPRLTVQRNNVIDKNNRALESQTYSSQQEICQPENYPSHANEIIEETKIPSLNYSGDSKAKEICLGYQTSKPETNISHQENCQSKIEISKIINDPSRNLIQKNDTFNQKPCIGMDKILKEIPKHLLNPSQRNKVLNSHMSMSHMINCNRNNEELKAEINLLDEKMKKLLGENRKIFEDKKMTISKPTSSNQKIQDKTRNVCCDVAMKNLINQLTQAEELFQKSHEENKRIERLPSKATIKKVEGIFNSYMCVDDKINQGKDKPVEFQKVSSLRKVFEGKSLGEKSTASSGWSTDQHKQTNIYKNSSHANLSKVNGNGDSINIKHFANLNSSMIDKIKEKVLSASKNNCKANQNYGNKTPKFPKETQVAMKLLMNKNAVGLNEKNKINEDNNEKEILDDYSKSFSLPQDNYCNYKCILQSKPKLKKKKNKPHIPCDKNLLCLKCKHLGKCNVRNSGSTEYDKDCQTAWTKFPNYYNGDLDLLSDCLGLTFRTN